MSDSEQTLQTEAGYFYRNYVHHSCRQDNSAKYYFMSENIQYPGLCLTHKHRASMEPGEDVGKCS